MVVVVLSPRPKPRWKKQEIALVIKIPLPLSTREESGELVDRYLNVATTKYMAGPVCLSGCGMCSNIIR